MKFINIREALDKLLIDKRISLVQLADLTGISNPALGKIATGKTENIRMDTLKRIEDGTGYVAVINDDKIHFVSKEDAPPISDPIMQQINSLLLEMPEKRKRKVLDFVDVQRKMAELKKEIEDEFELEDVGTG